MVLVPEQIFDRLQSFFDRARRSVRDADLLIGLVVLAPFALAATLAVAVA